MILSEKSATCRDHALGCAVPRPFADLIEQARLAGRALVEYGEGLVTPTVRLGITGLSRPGKTVFITALVHSLVRNGRYPVFEALSEGRIARARLSPQPDDAVPRFDYEHHIAALAADRVWPESTRQISELRLVVEFQSRSGAMRELVLDMVDYPGEWLLDLPLLSKSFEEWSAETLATSRRGPRAKLAAQWHAHLVERGVPCAWLSLDEDDNDKTRFMRHLVAALQKAEARIGQSVAANLSTDFPSDAKPLLETLAGDLATVQQRIVLFLDDLHFVEDTEVLEIAAWLVNYAPRTVQYVIGTRDKEPLRLSGLRVRRQLLELSQRELQFNSDEAAQFCTNRLGRDLSTQDLQCLMLKTEGWPAALELVTLVLADLPDPGPFIERFAGTDSGLVAYLCEVVLSRMDERTRTSVFRVSMFDRFCAPLAQAVCETDNGEELLRALRARNLFLIPLDECGVWVRFHHLVGESFRERYRRTSPVEARECLQRGAQWMHANGLVEEAVNCMIRAQDWEQATQWVAESVEELVFRRGCQQTILRWMNALPEACVARYPIIGIQYTFALSFYHHRHQEYEAQIYRLQQLLQRLEA